MRAPRDPLVHGPRRPLWTPPADGPERADRPDPRRGVGAVSVAAGSTGAGQVLPFRRRTGLPVRRRSRLAAFVRPFLLAAVIVGFPSVVLWWSATSPRFALADLEIHGSERVSADWMREQLADLLGRNLVWMPLDGVERTLSGHPWIAGVEVTKELPDRLRVVVVERRPVAILDEAPAGGDDGESRSFWIDADGSLIAPRAGAAARSAVQEGFDSAFVRLRWAGVSEVPAERRRLVLAAALGAAREVARAVPAWGGAVDSVTVLGDEDFRLEGAAMPFPLLVRNDSEGGEGEQGSEIASRVRRLEELLPEIRSEMGTRLAEPASIDLRFRHRIVVRPAVAETARGQERGA